MSGNNSTELTVTPLIITSLGFLRTLGGWALAFRVFFFFNNG